jgi:hypothetical protein
VSALQARHEGGECQETAATSTVIAKHKTLPASSSCGCGCGGGGGAPGGAPRRCRPACRRWPGGIGRLRPSSSSIWVPPPALGRLRRGRWAGGHRWCTPFAGLGPPAPTNPMWPASQSRRRVSKRVQKAQTAATGRVGSRPNCSERLLIVVRDLQTLE